MFLVGVSSLTLVPFEGQACTLTLVQRGEDLEAHQDWSVSRTRLDASLGPRLLPGEADFLDAGAHPWPEFVPQGR